MLEEHSWPFELFEDLCPRGREGQLALLLLPQLCPSHSDTVPGHPLPHIPLVLMPALCLEKGAAKVGCP